MGEFLNAGKMFFLRVLFLIVATLLVWDAAAMTRQQLKKSGQLLKKTCMPKNDVTEDQVGKIEQGHFLEEKNVMCYVACIYSSGGVVNLALNWMHGLKNNKIAPEAMVKQVDMMFPADMKEPVKAAVEKCRGAEKGKKYKDNCEISYYFAKCLYDVDPANFVFP